MKYLGCDLALDDDGDVKVKNGDIDIIEGRDCLSANLLDRILCSEGELLMHKDFGAALEDKISSPLGTEDKNSLMVEVKHELLKDPRIAEVLEMEVLDEGRIVYIRAKIKAVNGQVIGNLVFPFELEIVA